MQLINIPKNKEQFILNHAPLLLISIVLFGLLLRLIFFSGMGISDDLYYSYAATHLNTLQKDTLMVRVGIIYPTALSYAIFGVNDLSAVAFVLLTSLAGIVLIYYFGKLLFTPRIGILAAFLLSFFPMDVIYSTKLLSDIPSAFFMALGVYLFLYAQRKSPRYSAWWYIGSGICIGVGYVIRESALLIALFFMLYIIYHKKIKKEYFLVAAGVLLILLLESLYFYARTGDFLFRNNASQEYLKEALIKENYFGRLDFPKGLLHYPFMIATNPLIMMYYFFMILAIFFCLHRKKKESYILLLWFLPLLLYLSFGSASLLSYSPFKATERYLCIVTIPSILLMAYFLMAKHELTKKIILPGFLLALLVFSLAAMYAHPGKNELNDLKAAHDYFKKLNKPLYIDERSHRALAFITQYNPQPNIRSYPADIRTLSDAYIAINTAMLKKIGQKAPATPDIYDPPDTWIPVTKIGQNPDTIDVYFIPKK